MAEGRSMRIPLVKVCGLTREEDVLVALDAGADALGFVHHGPSPRSLEAGAIRQLTRLVPATVTRVLVVVEVTAPEAHSLALEAGVTAIQLCGTQRAADYEDFPLPILRRLGADEAARAELEQWRGTAGAFVVDDPGSPGGSGRTVDLEHAAELCAAAPCLLAGGLDADNVHERIKVAGPRGVDASSRLELSPGVKDAAAVRAFVTTARASIEAAPERT